ncbi:MAG: ABC transporter substrate-binding protein [Deinococcota bacterium]
MRKLISVGVVLVGLWLTGLGAAQTYPVTVEVCGEPVVFESAPERAIIFEANMLEIMLELGLDERIAGVWTGGIPSEKVQAPYVERSADIAIVSEESWPPPSFGVVLGTDPDFVWTGWGYGFSEDSGLTPENLVRAGIPSYTVSESCARAGGQQPEGFDALYDDILAAGAIFGVQDEAQVLVNELSAEVTRIDDAVGDVSQPLRVFNFDSGEDSPFTSGALSMPNTLIEQAGGTNIFADVQQDWMTVSWEEVVARDPEVILVGDSSWSSFEDKVAFLTSQPALADVSAVINERFVPMTYKQATPGLENITALENIARALYPDRLE